MLIHHRWTPDFARCRPRRMNAPGDHTNLWAIFLFALVARLYVCRPGASKPTPDCSKLAKARKRQTAPAKRVLRLLVTGSAAAALSGCLFNRVNPIPEGSTVSDRATVILYGVKFAGTWTAPRYAIGIDEYDLERQNITGNCWSYNHMRASVPATPGPTIYFAFEVPAGYYAYSPFSGMVSGLPSGKSVAFSVPEGRATYLGDFTREADGRVMLGGDFDAMNRWVDANLPSLKRRVSEARTVPAAPPAWFLCSP